MKQQIKLSDKVYTKDFSIKSVGYDCREVDSFFDEINIEIEKLEKKIESLESNNLRLESNEKQIQQAYNKLSQENANLKASKGTINSQNNNYGANVQILERLSTIEVKLESILNSKNDK